MSKFWTPARITELRALWDAGLSYEAIADHMGVSASSVENTRRLHGLPKRKQGRVKGSRNKGPVRLPEMVSKPYAWASDIPWPDKSRLMAGR